MDPERWRKITERFDAPTEYPAAERDSWLIQSCGGDVELLTEVRRLLAEFEAAGDFLERPMAAPGQAVSVGESVAGRYRIESLLGRGAFGEVYRAHDELIGEPVALKILRAEHWANREILRRFQREVQLARKVTHPNVCRVFEVGVHKTGGRAVHFFVMQLVEGETLAARIRRTGRIPGAEALPLIVQMTNGLQAAHDAGIVHRDFKSSNVILSGDRAIITDFGLARIDAGSGAAGTITTSVQVAGTVAYMSPEQLSGGEVTAASDIYSLGVVLFEMATGRLPFDDRHIINSAMQRASDTPPDVRTLAPDIDAAWVATIAGCLQLGPAQRFASATEVAERLRGRGGGKWTRRQWATAAGVATISAAAVSAISLVSRFHGQDGKSAAKLPEGADALLSPIANSTGDARFDGITELFRNQLAQSVHLNLLDTAKLGDALKQMGRPENTTDPAAVREAAWRLNAAISIFGNVSRIGPDYAVNIQLETRGSQPDRPRGKSLRSWTASDPEALMRTVGDASVWVRETVGESAASIANFDRLPSDATTPSWEALSDYARGQQFFMKQTYEPALLEFESALRRDPKFTLAALRRADLLVSRGRQIQGFAQYRDAIRMLNDRPVTRAEELNARGIFAFDSGDIDGSDKFFRTWAAEYPSDWRAPYYRVIGLILEGHAEQALEILKALRARMPEFGDLYAQTIAAHLVLGQTEQARSYLDRLRKYNGAERADLREGFVRFRDGDLVGYLGKLRAIQGSKNRRAAGDAMLHEAMLCVDARIPERVSRRVEAFLSSGTQAETLPEQSALRLVQAWSEMLSHERRAAIAHAAEALELESGPLMVALAGTVFARLGDVGRARQTMALSARFPDVKLYAIAQRRIAGELALAGGDRESAIREFRSAAELEPRIAHRQYLIEVLPAGPERLALCLNAVRIPWQALRPPPMHSLGSLSFAVPCVNSASGVYEPFARRFASSGIQLERAL